MTGVTNNDNNSHNNDRRVVSSYCATGNSCKEEVVGCVRLMVTEHSEAAAAHTTNKFHVVFCDHLSPKLGALYNENLRPRARAPRTPRAHLAHTSRTPRAHLAHTRRVCARTDTRISDPRVWCRGRRGIFARAHPRTPPPCGQTIIIFILFGRAGLKTTVKRRRSGCEDTSTLDLASAVTPNSTTQLVFRVLHKNPAAQKLMASPRSTLRQDHVALAMYRVDSFQAAAGRAPEMTCSADMVSTSHMSLM